MSGSRFGSSGGNAQQESAWTVLSAAGLPDGAPRAMHEDRFDDREVRAAVLELAPSAVSLDQTSRELLLGWLRGLRDHFPSRFGALLGEEGAGVITALERTELDAGRLIKFRRISIERLAKRI
jgi:hypothetical protein